MVLERSLTDTPDAHGTVELVVPDHTGLKLVGHPDGVPGTGGVAALDQSLNLIAAQVAPASLGLFGLSVA